MKTIKVSGSQNVKNHRERLNEKTSSRSEKGMRKSELLRKPGEANPKRFARHRNMVKKVTELTWVEINEQVELTSQSPVLNQRAKLLGRSMRQTEDELIRDLLATTAFAVFAVGGVNGDVPTELTLPDIQETVRGLLSHSARTVADSITATSKFGTAPLPNAYVGMGHTDLSSTLEGINGFKSTEQYASQNLLAPSEWGTVGKVRFLLSPRGSKNTASSGLNKTVYNTIITGMEAYSTIGLEKDNAKFIYHDYRIAGGPLEQNSTGGWKMSYAQAITNDAWVANLKSTI